MTEMVAHALLVFSAGALYEALGVAWIESAVARAPLKTSACSALQAGCQLTGLVEAVRDWRTAPAFVLGYAVGSYAGVWWMGRRT